MSLAPHSARYRARRAAAALAAATVAVVAVVGATAGPVAAASAAVNPLAGAGGFTTVSFGNTTLANHELEGSVAVGGNLVVKSTSPYNIIHKSAGDPNYNLPTLDTVPVRLVVGGALDRAASTNQMVRVSSGGANETTPARMGQIRIGNTSGDSVAGRGSGVCVQAKPFTDCNEGNGAMIEQSVVKQSTGSVQDAKAFNRLVPATAIADLTARNRAITAGELANTFETALVFSGNNAALNLKAGFTNVVKIDPSVIPTGDWYVQFGSVLPSAKTPVVFQVTAKGGDTLRLPTRFDGFQTGGVDIYARYLLWNVDQPADSTLNVTSSGIVPGSWLAPHGTLRADITGKTLLEGQIVAKTLELFNTGEIHHFGFDASLSFEPSSTGTATSSPDPSGSATGTPDPSGSATSTPDPSASATNTPDPSETAMSAADPSATAMSTPDSSVSATGTPTGTAAADVLDDPSGSDPAADDALAVTGIDAPRSAGIAALVILAGATLIAVRRRRTRTR